MDPPTCFAYSNLWDDSILSWYAFDVDGNYHCPMLAAIKGFSCQVKLPSIVDFITDLQPLFFPFGEQTMIPVPTPTGTITRAFFLPKVCDLLLGLVWPTTINYNGICMSIHALKGGYAHFLHILTTLQPICLTPWLITVQANLTHFMTPCVSFAEIQDTGYPGLDTGNIPSGISDLRAFSPILKMANGFVWHLTCNAVLTTGSQEAQKALQEYLKCSEIAITGSSYIMG
jgi:hypothetical protein